MKKKTTNDFKKEISSIYGDDVELLSEYKGNKKRVTILHKTCGRTSTPLVRAVQLGNACTKCGIDKRTEAGAASNRKSHEQFVIDVDKLVGDEYTVIGKYKMNKVKIEIKHNRCDITRAYDPDKFLFKGCRCRKCSSSKGEDRIYNYLFRNGYTEGLDFIQDKPLKGMGLLRPDFYFPKLKLIIEFNGEGHYIPKSIWGGEPNLKIVQRNDKRKKKLARKMGIQLRTIKYTEMKNIESRTRNILKERSTTIESTSEDGSE